MGEAGGRRPGTRKRTNETGLWEASCYQTSENQLQCVIWELGRAMIPPWQEVENGVA